MIGSITRRTFTLSGLCATLPVSKTTLSADSLATDQDQRILIVVGPSKHPPGTHEVAATGRLLQYCVQQIGIAGFKVELAFEWPEDTKLLDLTASVVFIGDFFPPARMAGTSKIMSDLTSMMNRGCGMVCVHYATGLGPQDVEEDGQHPLLQWIGGYFATKCKHHQSIARVFENATIVPIAKKHEVLNGWQAFTVHDEPYINNYFGKAGMGPGVTSLATASLPPENPREETVAWAIERSDGGRGVGVVMPHFFRNWVQDDMRKMILNSIVWSAKVAVPNQGVDVSLPDLSQFAPVSVEPITKKS